MLASPSGEAVSFFPGPMAARCSVCDEFAWKCQHAWELRIPQEEFEARARDLPWPCKPEDVRNRYPHVLCACGEPLQTLFRGNRYVHKCKALRP